MCSETRKQKEVFEYEQETWLVAENMIQGAKMELKKNEDNRSCGDDQKKARKRSGILHALGDGLKS